MSNKTTTQVYADWVSKTTNYTPVLKPLRLDFGGYVLVFYNTQDRPLAKIYFNGVRIGGVTKHTIGFTGKSYVFDELTQALIYTKHSIVISQQTTPDEYTLLALKHGAELIQEMAETWRKIEGIDHSLLYEMKRFSKKQQPNN